MVSTFNELLGYKKSPLGLLTISELFVFKGGRALRLSFTLITPARTAPTTYYASQRNPY